MRIAIDAMGGDRAPAAPVEGALRALQTYEDVEILLVGDPELIAAERARHPEPAEQAVRLAVHDAPEVARMDDDPVRAVRSSTRVSARACADLLHAGHVDGVLTMGSTGAAVAAATLFCRRLEGVRRTGIAVPFPHADGVTVVIDCGANPDAKAEHLVQYGLMATHYVRAALGVESPRVGILSIGEEEHKGNRLVAETWAGFRAEAVPHFVGNVEARELFDNKADVVVCDGFAGNVALKTAEGMAEYLMRALAGAGDGGPSAELAGALQAAAREVDYAEYGGAPLLGVEGAYVIGHGRSTARAFLNGVRVIRSYVQHDVGRRIVEELKGRGATSAAEREA